MPDEWYRSTEWDEAAEAEFERRLARARPHNRIQYRYVKAAALLNTDDRIKQSAAVAMLRTVIEADAGWDFWRVGSLNMLSEHARAEGRLDEAEGYVREVLRLAGPDGNGTDGEEEIRLAEILLERGDRGQLDEAGQLLERRASDMPLFVKSRFRLCVAIVRLLLARHDPAAAEWATAAVTLGEATHSGLTNHPTVGLVETDAAALAWLWRIADGKPE